MSLQKGRNASLILRFFQSANLNTCGLDIFKFFLDILFGRIEKDVDFLETYDVIRH
jgi:hypothetical protein